MDLIYEKYFGYKSKIEKNKAFVIEDKNGKEKIIAEKEDKNIDNLISWVDKTIKSLISED